MPNFLGIETQVLNRYNPEPQNRIKSEIVELNITLRSNGNTSIISNEQIIKKVMELTETISFEESTSVLTHLHISYLIFKFGTKEQKAELINELKNIK